MRLIYLPFQGERFLIYALFPEVEKMDMKGSDMVYAVCNDCHTFKMGDKSFKSKKGFMTCDGCGQALHELKW